MRSWDSIYLWDDSASSYVDLEFAAADLAGSAVSLIGQTADKLYMGLDRTFNSAFFELDTLGTLTILVIMSIMMVRHGRTFLYRELMLLMTMV